ncbi:MAG: PilN domain-containing protein [Saezia sp.]
MILINLLPHREEARKKAKESFYAKLLLSAIVGAGISVLIWSGVAILETKQSSTNSVLMSENSALDSTVKKIEESKKVISALEARRVAVENLQEDRSLVVRWMADLARLTPEGVYLTKLVQDGLTLKVEGRALSYDHISQFIKNTSSGNMQTITNSHWTGEVKMESMDFDSNRPAMRVFLFSLEFDLMRSADLKRMLEGEQQGANNTNAR